MAISVMALPPTSDYAPEEITYPDATKWVVDDDERLHIVGRDGNLATYNRGFWANVQKVDIKEDPADSVQIGKLAVSAEDAEAIQSRARRDALRMNII